MNKPTVLPADPQLYLLRVWRNTDRFRAAVRRVDSEATQWLESPQAVADWLAADDHAPPAGAAPFADLPPKNEAALCALPPR